MKILLLTDIPPSTRYPGALVLEQISRFLPEGAVVCFAVVNPAVNADLPEDMDWMPIHYVDKPDERAIKLVNPFAVLAHPREILRDFKDRKLWGGRTLRKAEAFGRLHQVDAVFAVLQGQTVINLAEPLAKRLGVPLYTLVFDPLVWWLKDHLVDPYTAKFAYRSFDKAIRASTAVAAASWAMAEEYERKYGVRALPIIRSHEAEIAQHPPLQLPDDGALIIGIAGEIYAIDETEQLVTALNACGWVIRGRKVKLRAYGRLRAFGQFFPQMPIPDGHLELMGWRAEQALVEELAQCHLLYCPYPFDPDIDEVSRLSFPSKLVSYLAAGRPVLLHGPANSSPSRYVRQRGAGVCAEGKYASSIYNAIDRLVRDPAVYERAVAAVQEAFAADFTLRQMKSRLFELFGFPPDGPPAPVDSGRRFAPVDERSPALKAAAHAGPRPSRLWVLIQSLRRPRDLFKGLRAFGYPVRKRIDIERSWEFRKYPGPASEFFAGEKPWDYVAGVKLDLAKQSSPHLSVTVTSAQEEVYLLLVDRDYHQVGERFAISKNKPFSTVWFDLNGMPPEVILIVQVNEAPRMTRIQLHRVSFLVSWKAVFRGKGPARVAAP